MYFCFWGILNKNGPNEKKKGLGGLIGSVAPTIAIQHLGACCCGCWYTMFCWDPTAGKPEGGVQVQPSGAPAETDMER